MRQSPPASTAKGAHTRQAILQSAIACFGREGYRATSVSRIARDAGVGATAPYAYFPNKEALFISAVDADVSAALRDGLSSIADSTPLDSWRLLLVDLAFAVDRHPLARRLLAGLEPDMMAGVLEIPALAELRKGIIERLHLQQLAGTVRNDIDYVAVGDGLVTIYLALLMSTVQLGGERTAAYNDGLLAVFAAVLEPLVPSPLAGAGR